jgi:hypothetical protein
VEGLVSTSLAIGDLNLHLLWVVVIPVVAAQAMDLHLEESHVGSLILTLHSGQKAWLSSLHWTRDAQHLKVAAFSVGSLLPPLLSGWARWFCTDLWMQFAS